MSPSCYVVSLKYSPGLKKEFEVIGQNLSSLGCRVTYLLSMRYAWMFQGNQANVVYLTDSQAIRSPALDLFHISGLLAEVSKIFQVRSPHFICFYNMHPFNPWIAKLAESAQPQGIRSLYLHEPYKPDKSVYGQWGRMKIHLVECVQTLCLKWINCVILPSQTALERFRVRYPTFIGETHLCPILVPDSGVCLGGRRFFSYTGLVNPATGLDTFVELVNRVSGSRPEFEFLIITSSAIYKYMLRLRPKTSVQIINRKRLTDEEIDSAMRQSLAVLKLDREITQSGVIPVAFRNGTPVIVRDIAGLKQFVQHKSNGFVVHSDAGFDGLIEGMEYCKKHIKDLSDNCRQYFQATFASSNWPRYYCWLIERLGLSSSGV